MRDIDYNRTFYFRVITNTGPRLKTVMRHNEALFFTNTRAEISVGICRVIVAIGWN